MTPEIDEHILTCPDCENTQFDRISIIKPDYIMAHCRVCHNTLVIDPENDLQENGTIACSVSYRPTHRCYWCESDFEEHELAEIHIQETMKNYFACPKCKTNSRLIEIKIKKISEE